MQQRAPLFVVGSGTRLIIAFLAIVWILSITEHASAFECLAYKPERAVGQWHAEVVSGKICWYGPNRHPFLPKPKSRAENSQVTNSKPKLKMVNRKPDAQVVKAEIENNQPDAQIENDGPHSQIAKVENSKPDIQIEKPDTVLTSPPSEGVDLYRTEDSSAAGKATPVETAEFTSPASLEFNHEPAILKTNTFNTSEPQSLTSLLVAFSIVAFGTVALVMLIMRARTPQDAFDTDVPLEHIPVDEELAPPLQPNSDEEYVVHKESELNRLN